MSDLEARFEAIRMALAPFKALPLAQYSDNCLLYYALNASQNVTVGDLRRLIALGDRGNGANDE